MGGGGGSSGATNSYTPPPNPESNPQNQDIPPQEADLNGGGGTSSGGTPSPEWGDPSPVITVEAVSNNNTCLKCTSHLPVSSNKYNLKITVKLNGQLGNPYVFNCGIYWWKQTSGVPEKPSKQDFYYRFSKLTSIDMKVGEQRVFYVKNNVDHADLYCDDVSGSPLFKPENLTFGVLVMGGNIKDVITVGTPGLGGFSIENIIYNKCPVTKGAGLPIPTCTPTPTPTSA